MPEIKQQKEKKTVDNRKLLNQEEVINTKVSQGLKILITPMYNQDMVTQFVRIFFVAMSGLLVL